MNNLHFSFSIGYRLRWRISPIPEKTLIYDYPTQREGGRRKPIVRTENNRTRQISVYRKRFEFYTKKKLSRGLFDFRIIQNRGIFVSEGISIKKLRIIDFCEKSLSRKDNVPLGRMNYSLRDKLTSNFGGNIKISDSGIREWITWGV